MKKTILFGSIIAVFLMLMIPNISAVEYNQVIDVRDSLLKSYINEKRLLDICKNSFIFSKTVNLRLIFILMLIFLIALPILYVSGFLVIFGLWVGDVVLKWVEILNGNPIIQTLVAVFLLLCGFVIALIWPLIFLLNFRLFRLFPKETI